MVTNPPEPFHSSDNSPPMWHCKTCGADLMLCEGHGMTNERVERCMCVTDSPCPVHTECTHDHLFRAGAEWRCFRFGCTFSIRAVEPAMTKAQINKVNALKLNLMNREPTPPPQNTEDV